MTPEEDTKMQALEKVRAEREKHGQAKKAESAQREALRTAIVEALTAGAGPTELGEASGYDRQHINRIRVKAGLPARRAATVQKIQKGDPAG
jgi:hypothetical protein